MGIPDNSKECYDDFLNTTYFSVDAVKAFAGKESTSKDRMDLISRFLNLGLLDKAASLAKVKFNGLQGELDVIQGKMSVVQNRLAQDFDLETYEEKIDDLEEEIDKKKAVNKVYRKQLSELDLLKSLQEQRDNITLT